MVTNEWTYKEQGLYDMIIELKENLYKALIKHFEAKREKALYQMNLGFQKPVAVGEHPTLIEDMIKMTEEVAAAEESLEILTKYFGDIKVHD